MILRHFEREAARKRDEMREHLENEHAKSEVQDKQLKDMEKDKNPLLVRLKAKVRCEKWCFCLHFSWHLPMTSICCRPRLVWEGCWVCTPELIQQLILLLLNRRIHRGVLTREQKSNTQHRVSSVLMRQVLNLSANIYIGMADLTHGLSVFCQGDCCQFWRSSTLSVWQW